jgi:hypothetical protein
MIYIMRHPVDRAYSFYVHNIKSQQLRYSKLKVEETFEEAIKRDGRLLDSSDYMMQIEQYLKLFPRESFLFLLMEDLIENPADTMRKIFSFIGVDENIDVIQEAPIVANQARTYKQWFVRSRITAPLKRIPGVASIASLLPQEVRDQVYHQVLQRLPYKKNVEKEYLPPPMRPETRQMLLARFRESNQRLANFLNRDLSHWDR